MTRLYLADTGPLCDQEVYGRLYENASPERRAKADSFKFLKDRRLSIAAAALLDSGLSVFGLREKDMEYGFNEYGKPFFLNAPEVHFSLSHSGTKVAVAFSDSEVGCDIEQIEDIEMDVAKNFFHPEEYAFVLCQASEQERLDAFYRIWTLKESYMKATGKGMSLSPVAFSVFQDLDLDFLAPDSFEGYKCAVCGKNLCCPLDVRISDFTSRL